MTWPDPYTRGAIYYTAAVLLLTLANTAADRGQAAWQADRLNANGFNRWFKASIWLTYAAVACITLALSVLFRELGVPL